MSNATFRASLQSGWNENACRALIRQGSKSFYAASLLLPQRIRKPAYALYAFCRLSDDAVDARDAPADAVERQHQRLDLAYAETPMAIPADRAFAQMVADYQMPRALPQALLEGLAWDAAGWQPRTLDDGFAYSARVAAAVGAMMTVLMGKRDPHVLARACDLGVAMQLTNIALDVGEDARNGRVYLPHEWLEDAGVDIAAFMANPVFDERIAACTGRLLDEADALYDRCLSGIDALPSDCRPAIHAARLIYREIGVKLRQNGLNSVDGRTVVGKGRKLALLGAASNAALLARPLGAKSLSAPPLAQNVFLVDCVPPFDHGRNGEAVVDRRPMARIVHLLEQLERRDRAAMAQQAAHGSMGRQGASAVASD